MIKTPHPYQEEGIQFLVEHGYGCLWDDPGLGKTLQAIIAANTMNTRPSKNGGQPVTLGKILVICPNSNKLWWAKELASLYPDQPKAAVSIQGGRFRYWSKKFRTFLELDPVKYLEKCPSVTWMITHYTGARLQAQAYGQIGWSVVILDEAHYIKNRKAARTKAVQALTPPLAYRIALTATPFGKNPADLWSQLRWIAPEIDELKSFWRFFNHFVDYEEKRHKQRGYRYKEVHGGKNLEILANLMSNFGLQRTKREVAPQLPPITITDLPIQIEGRQEKVYEALREKDRVEVVIKHTDQPPAEAGDLLQGAPTPRTSNPEKPGGVLGVAKPRYTAKLIKNALSRLSIMEQWLSCPWEYDPGVLGAKMEWLEEWASTYKEPAVITTRFKASARHIATALTESKKVRARYNSLNQGKDTKAVLARYITGDVPQRTRAKIIDQWKAGEFQFLVGTIHTMGVGLNLQHGWALICYDQVYDPILMTQVHQRLHRIDSTHPVEVINLYCKGTSNEVVLNAYKRKWTQMRLVQEFLRHLREGGA